MRPDLSPDKKPRSWRRASRLSCVILVPVALVAGGSLVLVPRGENGLGPGTSSAVDTRPQAAGSFVCGRTAPGFMRPERPDLSLKIVSVRPIGDGRPEVGVLVTSKQTKQVEFSVLRVIVTDGAGRVVAGQDGTPVPLSLEVRTVGPKRPARLTLYPQGDPCRGTEWKPLWDARANYRALVVASTLSGLNDRSSSPKSDQNRPPLLLETSLPLSGPR